ncbi:metal ABC transporter solute-binding protein, Zn/Mn family [Alkaliphilus metalliredigens]|uniref:metal ABC transporter solute-binding protein, Zn/Mn family n=1 Tax=Alkaliphilus metalliredigens TaxID=208226 RepID=UPI000A02B376|nr:zinc ABC transporter substrate-binding protein [Alkaliphilus metalliredigens]
MTLQVKLEETELIFKQLFLQELSPIVFEIPTRTLAHLEAADVFIYNGAEMEPWIDQVLELLKDKDIIIVNASESVELLAFNDGHGHSHDEDDHHDDDHGHSHDEDEHHDDDHGHSHDEDDHHDGDHGHSHDEDDHHDDDHGHSHDEDDHHDDDHDHGEYDPHIWVDPINAIKISEQIKLAFVARDPEHHAVYEENFEVFKTQLEKLDEDFRAGLQDIKQRKIIVSHSAFGYLAHRYGLEEISVSGISPHAEPSPGRLAELTKVAREENINYIFFEELANPRTAETLANEANLEALILNNIEGLTEAQLNAGEDFISLMYKNIETLQRALME